MRPPRPSDSHRKPNHEGSPVRGEFASLPVVRPVPARALIAGIASAVALLAAFSFKAQHTHYEKVFAVLQAKQQEEGKGAASAGLAVQLELPAAAIAGVQIGSQLEVFLDAYPAPRFQPVQVTVTALGEQMSTAQLGPAESAESGRTSGAGAARRGVLVARGQVTDDASLKLLPGMTGRAQVATEQRSILSWLLVTGGTDER